MFDRIVQVALNDRLIKATHWTVFGIGAFSLVFSIVATAASAL